MKNGQGIENRFVVMTTDSGKRVKVWKDIRQESSLGYQDVKKRDKRSLMDRIIYDPIDRIIELYADIKDFPENL
jgi:hypothetical protein